MKTFLIASLAIVFLACQPRITNDNTQLEGNFEITHLEDKQPIPHQASISFDPATKQVAGNAACNNYFGTYTQKGKMLTFGELASSLKLCIDEQAMNTENKLMKLLPMVRSYEWKNNILELKDENDKLVLMAKPAKVADEKNFTLEYSTETMIGEKKITYANQKMSCITDGKTSHQKTLSVSESKDIEYAFTELTLEDLHTHEAPSSERHLDGAAYAKLKIVTGTKTYESQQFDHGNPPAAIARIVSLINQQNACNE